MPFALAIQQAPRLRGAYLARQTTTGPVVYVGMAGQRRGQGITGRLTVYYRSKAAVSGLGEAALDRALADVEGLRQREWLRWGLETRAGRLRGLKMPSIRICR